MKEAIHVSEKEVAVVIPVYKSNPAENELIYFEHNCKVLKDHEIVVVAPADLDLSKYANRIKFSVEYFSPVFFENISGYNRLMLSMVFYKRFNQFKYILICQTDAFVFKNELIFWCRKDYDYIGAPWIGKPFFLFQYVFVKMGVMHAVELLKKHNLYNAVGNGGFSLRKVSTFTKALEDNSLAGKWIANEDFYWSFFAKTENGYLKKPESEEASLFCIEVSPKKTMKKQKNVLPFGIHAWEKINTQFWQPYVQEALFRKN